MSLSGQPGHDRRVEDLLRELTPQVLGALVRRHGDLARCEDAVQEALLAAHTAWVADGVPGSPRGWLVTVATRRLIDALRADAARERRELALSQQVRLFAPAADEEPQQGDDSLALLFLCCHPALTPASQLVLTLRAVGGLTTAEIAAALLLPETTVARRITRAKATVREAGARFAVPSGPELIARLDVVHQVLYLVFTEGHAAAAGPELNRPNLCAEALRLARLLHGSLPSSSETTGLLALMLLVDSRRATRQDDDGALVPLAEQDRDRWDHAAITEGARLTEAALRTGPVGPYQLQAAVAAVHALAPSAEDTDWAEIVGLFDVLQRLAPSPVVDLNRAVALGMRDGPRAGLAALDDLDAGPLATGHRLPAVRAYLLERAGDTAAAALSYRQAAARATNLAEQKHLALRARRAEQHLR
ncbi:RNA polymerase sigma factor [uncultured Pseudokineococcus sp.]|uniref:RNA polymerase sigma factor n=1 Tax=uncultured Pseudokineococcus sp. TaxID=1642928 RepID=UPI002627D1D2|nr:sigma-70 family RNA polymerase sigma factor [uncultured Pseudokineococcus sp.]